MSQYEIFYRDQKNNPLGYMHYNVRRSRNLTPEQVEQILIEYLHEPMYQESAPNWHTVIIWGPTRRLVLTRDQVQRMRK